GGDGVDLAERVERFSRERGGRAADMRRLAEGWARQAERAGLAPQGPDLTAEILSRPGSLLALAYPDRIARSRGKDGAYVMVQGRAGQLDPASALAREPFIVVADLAGSAGSARILAAAAIDPEEIRAIASVMITVSTTTTFDDVSGQLRARTGRRLGAVVLDERTLPVPPDEASARILARGLAGLGLDRLPRSAGQRQWLARVRFLRAAEAGDWPDLSEEALARSAEEWLAPAIVGRTGRDAVTADDLGRALDALLPWNLRARLDAEAPSHLEVPTGSHIPIDYESGPEPVLAVRVQELFGLDRHPSLGGGRVPLVLHLLSPAQRPIQITRDLPGFWRGSWAAVRSEMRGRYPRHPWPEDPLSEAPTRRAKPRGT
ncbi:ATP-dependent helicase C-terminal domain-containing protein, partial [Methylobacterium brachythecii]